MNEFADLFLKLNKSNGIFTFHLVNKNTLLENTKFVPSILHVKYDHFFYYYYIPIDWKRKLLLIK